ncbi:class I SAM-dependent methyltransferase [archaeon]|jgi:ubiquinone/menaquinone biosynthesis C-methylase UbiE|nr:class I SAM-dependent methyltransferase [archaeon]MBT4647006.1 class I SAM-dependent methyltransferase [archaeon]MBT6822472.1 class I SAM-dependent methyltransferase [archaeon]MBT7392001.1 class I SAM-dependent methyltransferase [archaeon]
MYDPIGKILMNWRIKKVLPQINENHLDIGCGSNKLSKKYKIKNKEAISIGIDVHPWKNVDKIIKDSSNLSYDDNYFDTITIVASLNHIINRHETLKECNRLLKDDGRLIITMIPQKF